MKTKVLKISVGILILISIIMIGNHNVFAIKDPAELIISQHVPDDDELEDLGEKVLGVTTIIGYAMAIIILIAIGMKYMTGSVEEKASYKKTMIPYVVGCVILVAAPTLTNIVYEASKPLKASVIIKTEICGCGALKTENCIHRKTGRGPGFKEVYYCTGCETQCIGSKCSICGGEYTGD